MTALILPNFINGVETYDTLASFPTDDVFDGKVGIALDTKTVYVYDVGTTSWVVFAGGAGTTNHAAMSNLDYASAAHTGFEKALTFGAGLNRAVDTITVPTAGIKANMLQAAAADLGAANVTVNLSNSNGAFVTNVTIDGTMTAGAFAGPLTGDVTGNADTVTTNANLTGPVTSVGNATAIASGAIKANMLQAAAADLGAADVEINLGNTNGAFVTNVTTDGSFSGLTYKIGATQVVGAQVAAIGLDAKSDTDKITDIIAALRAHGLLGPNA